MKRRDIRQDADPLGDPIAFTHEAWDLIVGSGEIDLDGLMHNAGHDLVKLRNEADALARRAARTPGVNVDRYLGIANDLANDEATTAYSAGMEMGAVLEQLRQGLIACRASLREPSPGIDSDRRQIAALRAELDTLSARPGRPDRADDVAA